MAGPIEQFEIKPIVSLGKIGGSEIAFTNSALFMVAAVAIIVLLFVYGTRNRSLVPGRLQSLAEIETLFRRTPGMWEPDHLFLLQELLPHDPDQGIVRLEFVGGELLYAMRVKTHGRFNLCPSPVCNPDEGDSACALPNEPAVTAPPVEFAPFPEVPAEAVDTAKRIVKAAGLAVGGIEYLETPAGRRVFYDINANSNLRPSVAAAFGFDPFERVVDYLLTDLEIVRKSPDG